MQIELHRSLNKFMFMNAHILILLLVLTLFHFTFYNLFTVTESLPYEGFFCYYIWFRTMDLSKVFELHLRCFR